MNQQGINAQGTPVSGGLEARRAMLIKTIHEGRGTIMPAWGQENGGQLNDEQIEELVTMIMHVDWNEVYNKSIEAAGGYPTVVPTTAPTQAAGGATTPAAGGDQGGESGGIELGMHDTYFDPTSVTIPADTETTIKVTNHGALPHNFSVPQLNISVDVDAGASVDVTIPATAAGEYDFDCNVPGHKDAGMIGKLIVSADAKPAADAPAAPPASTEAPAGGEAAAPQGVTITMGDTFFDPTTATIPANTAVTFTLVNNGALGHNFSIPTLNISVDVAAGETTTVEVNAAAGSYPFDCDVPGHADAGMVGTLTVQ
jgi:uncharacterized cupredoxin-like copper-binding protein